MQPNGTFSKPIPERNSICAQRDRGRDTHASYLYSKSVDVEQYHLGFHLENLKMVYVG